MSKKERALELLTKASEHGKIFNVIFTKLDGSERKMNCRTGVTKHLKGGPKKYDAQGAFGVYEVPTNGYRCLYPENVISVNGELV